MKPQSPGMRQEFLRRLQWETRDQTAKHPVLLREQSVNPNHPQGLAQFDRQLAHAVHDINSGQKRMADKPTAKRNSLALLARVLNSTGREQEDEAAALISRRQKNHARFLELAAKGHSNEKIKEMLLGEAENEQALDDLEAALGSNGDPSLEEPVDPALTKAKEDLAAAKSSPDAS